MVLVGIAVITGAHFLLGMESAAAQAAHVVLGALYFAPIIGAAWWFGWRTGVVLAVLTAAIYWVHVFASWPADPFVYVTQATMMSLLVGFAALTGVLVERRREEQARRFEAKDKADRSLAVSGMAALTNLLTARGDGAHEQGERVGQIVSAVGLKLGLEPDRLDLLRLAARIHGIGRAGARGEALLDPGLLSTPERAEVERHVFAASALLRPLRGMEEAADLVLSHHECPDGSGHPRRLRAGEIPIEASILRVADVFAALTDGLAAEHQIAVALGRMRDLAGTKLDREAVQALEDVVGRWTGSERSHARGEES